MSVWLRLLIVIGVLASVPDAAAHHPLEDYRSCVRTLDGIVVQLTLQNPHSVIVMKVNGSSERWTIEWISAAALQRQGVTSSTLRLGDRLVLTGNPARDRDEHRLWLRTMTRPQDRWTWTGNFK